MRRPTPLAPGARVGLTTTIPVEVVLAANLIPVDLNNLFIADPAALSRVSQAEAAGFPRTLCAWIKGIYAALVAHPEIQAVIAACQGDCSNTQALGELLAAEGIEVIHFKFPYPRNREQLAREIDTLADRLGADPDAVARVQARLAPLRLQLRRLDRLTWETGQVQAGRISSGSSPARILPRTWTPTNNAWRLFFRRRQNVPLWLMAGCAWGLPVSRPSSPTCGPTWRNWGPTWFITNFPGNSACPMGVRTWWSNTCATPTPTTSGAAWRT